MQCKRFTLSIYSALIYYTNLTVMPSHIMTYMILKVAPKAWFGKKYTYDTQNATAKAKHCYAFSSHSTSNVLVGTEDFFLVQAPHV